MKFYKLLPFLIPLAMIATGLILITLNACNGPLTNWGQGRAPTPGQCPPGTIQIDVEDLFLECYRGTTQ